MQTKLISIVTPVYNEEASILDCCNAVREIFERELPEFDYEHIICDNASTDSTVEKLHEIAQRDRRVKVIFNNRNFGAVPSNLNGIYAASGDAVLLCLPADLQDPPEMIATFVRHWESGYEVVCGVREQRQESWLMRLMRECYYCMINLAADANIPRQVGLFQLVDSKVVRMIADYGDQNPFVRGMIADGGYKTKLIPYSWKARQHGKSKIPIYSLIDQALNGVLYYTKLPMRFCLLGGSFLAVASICYAAASCVLALLSPQSAEAGIPTLIAGMFFLFGVQFAFMGVLGEYIGAIYDQVRPRSKVVEQSRLNFDSPTVGIRKAG